MLPTGEERRFLANGDSVRMRGLCHGAGFRVGFGEVIRMRLVANRAHSLFSDFTSLTAPLWLSTITQCSGRTCPDLETGSKLLRRSLLDLLRFDKRGWLGKINSDFDAPRWSGSVSQNARPLAVTSAGVSYGQQEGDGYKDFNIEAMSCVQRPYP